MSILESYTNQTKKNIKLKIELKIIKFEIILKKKYSKNKVFLKVNKRVKPEIKERKVEEQIKAIRKTRKMNPRSSKMVAVTFSPSWIA